MARQSMVVMLDTAATSGQVRPLLPGAGGNLVVVTSRHRLDGLVATHGVTRWRPCTRTTPVAGLPPAQARSLLDQLAAAHLVHEWDADRYHLHDLVRLFAVERATAELPRDDPAEVRLLTWYRDAANAADRTLRPAERPKFASGPLDPPVRFTTPAAALTWLDEEADNLVAAVETAATAEPRLAWQIAAALYGWLSAGTTATAGCGSTPVPSRRRQTPAKR